LLKSKTFIFKIKFNILLEALKSAYCCLLNAKAREPYTANFTATNYMDLIDLSNTEVSDPP